jgi:uncharacterized protein (UPF0332 family)
MLATADRDLQFGKLALPVWTTDAAKFGYMAAFHAAMTALVIEKGAASKTHSGVRSAFSLLAKDHPALGREWGTFLARTYKYKHVSDYRFEDPIPREEAEEVLAKAAELVALVKALAKNA